MQGHGASFILYQIPVAGSLIGSMKIIWRLDEARPLDPENLLGDITLSNGHTVLQERQTYIDSWLDALITGLQAVQAGKAIRVDIPEEPDALVFEPVEKGVRLSYRALALEVESVEALHGALLLAATALLQELAEVEGWERHALLHGIRDFVSNPQEVSSKVGMHT